MRHFVSPGELILCDLLKFKLNGRELYDACKYCVLSQRTQLVICYIQDFLSQLPYTNDPTLWEETKTNSFPQMLG